MYVSIQASILGINQRNFGFGFNLLPIHDKENVLMLMHHTIRFIEVQNEAQQVKRKVTDDAS
jgi:hypothetical protein